MVIEKRNPIYHLEARTSCAITKQCGYLLRGTRVNGKCECRPYKLRVKREANERDVSTLGHDQAKRHLLRERAVIHLTPAAEDDAIRACGFGSTGCPRGQHHAFVDGNCICTTEWNVPRRDLSISEKPYDSQTDPTTARRAEQSNRDIQERDATTESTESTELTESSGAQCPNTRCPPNFDVAYSNVLHACTCKEKPKGPLPGRCHNPNCPAWSKTEWRLGSCVCISPEKRDPSISVTPHDSQSDPTTTKRAKQSNRNIEERVATTGPSRDQCPNAACPPNYEAFYNYHLGGCTCKEKHKTPSNPCRNTPCPGWSVPEEKHGACVCGAPGKRDMSAPKEPTFPNNDHKLVKRDDTPAGCDNFNCPTGFTAKMNGDVCYCGIDQDSPYPQGPASLGPHGGLPGNYEQDAPSSSVDLDGEVDQAQKRGPATLVHLTKKRQLVGCENLGCPSGYIPSMDSGMCYCGLDGGYAYPQEPASMGPQNAVPDGSLTADSGDEDDAADQETSGK
ncbi:MAG: hypothetical protein Q9170_000686 [Blastenia crenularia]